MKIYVDGGAGRDPKYCYLVHPSGETRIVRQSSLTNNQAEYKAILRALVDHQDCKEPIQIFSDSKNTVEQINHNFAINNEQLRKLAKQVWELLPQMDAPQITFTWVPRKENLAGKLIGS